MGVIDKNCIGNTKSGGITHVLMNDKGPEAARMFLGLNQRMVNYWLMEPRLFRRFRRYGSNSRDDA